MYRELRQVCAVAAAGIGALYSLGSRAQSPDEPVPVQTFPVREKPPLDLSSFGQVVYPPATPVPQLLVGVGIVLALAVVLIACLWRFSERHKHEKRTVGEAAAVVFLVLFASLVSVIGLFALLASAVPEGIKSATWFAGMGVGGVSGAIVAAFSYSKAVIGRAPTRSRSVPSIERADFAVALIAGGVLVSVAGVLFADGFNPRFGLIWNAREATLDFVALTVPYRWVLLFSLLSIAIGAGLLVSRRAGRKKR